MRFRLINRFVLAITLGAFLTSPAALANGGTTPGKKIGTTRNATSKTPRTTKATKATKNVKATKTSKSAKTSSNSKISNHSKYSKTTKTVGHVAAPAVTKDSESTLKMLAIYDSLKLDELGLNQKVFRIAIKGMERLRKMGKLTNDHVLSIVDFSQPSVQKRMYVIDVENCSLLFNTLVAHGMKSGKEKAMSFSNKLSSNKSSLGFYVTNSTYIGSNGYSLRLLGCEKGFNDNAAKRAIVVHAADYVNEDWIPMQGYIGRSQGCPALPPDLSGPMINEIKDGTCLFIYHPNAMYLSKSQLAR